MNEMNEKNSRSLFLFQEVEADKKRALEVAKATAPPPSPQHSSPGVSTSEGLAPYKFSGFNKILIFPCGNDISTIFLTLLSASRGTYFVKFSAVSFRNFAEKRKLPWCRDV